MKVNGLKIDIAIAEKGYRRSEFCKICNLTLQTLARVITTNNTTMFTAVKIAKGLDIPVTELMTDEEQRRKINEQSNLNG